MSTQLILNSHDYFSSLVEEAFNERKVKTYPQIQSYVVDLLKHHLFIENLYDEEDANGKKTRKTLAELFLQAGQESRTQRVGKMKLLGDRSLYISGFFSDSFQRKIIDIDYYVDMGRMAFESLSKDVSEDTFSKLFRDISSQFLTLVDVLAFISQKANMTNDENILRMMDVYSKTGSSLVGEALVEKGIFNRPEKKSSKQ